MTQDNNIYLSPPEAFQVLIGLDITDDIVPSVNKDESLKKRLISVIETDPDLKGHLEDYLKGMTYEESVRNRSSRQ